MVHDFASQQRFDTLLMSGMTTYPLECRLAEKGSVCVSGVLIFLDGEEKIYRNSFCVGTGTLLTSFGLSLGL